MNIHSPEKGKEKSLKTKLQSFFWVRRNSRKKIEEQLSNQNKYDAIKKIMEEKNIDEHSLNWAELFIKNWLADYVVANIKEFICDHNDIVDLLIVNHRSDLLLWEDNNMVNDFQVDTNETLEKLYYTDSWNSFRGVTMSETPNNEKFTPKLFTALEKFENNPLLRAFVIDEFKKSGFESRWFNLRRGNLDKFIDLLTSEEFEKNEDFINKIRDYV